MVENMLQMVFETQATLQSLRGLLRCPALFGFHAMVEGWLWRSYAIVTVCGVQQAPSSPEFKAGDDGQAGGRIGKEYLRNLRNLRSTRG